MKYKIVKEVSRHTHRDLYKVYRHVFWFYWKFIDFQFSVKEAEKRIQQDKEVEARKRVKPEVVGYYE